MNSVHLGKPCNITVIQVCATITNAKEAKVEQSYDDLLIPKQEVLFIIGDWNAKVGSQEIPGVTGKFGLEVQNEAVQRLTSSGKKMHVIGNTLFQQHKK